MGYLEEDRVKVKMGEKKREISSDIPEKKQRVARLVSCRLVAISSYSTVTVGTE